VAEKRPERSGPWVLCEKSKTGAHARGNISTLPPPPSSFPFLGIYFILFIIISATNTAIGPEVFGALRHARPETDLHVLVLEEVSRTRPNSNTFAAQARSHPGDFGTQGFSFGRVTAFNLHFYHDSGLFLLQVRPTPLQVLQGSFPYRTPLHFDSLLSSPFSLLILFFFFAFLLLKCCTSCIRWL